MLLRLGIEPTTPDGDPEGYAELYRVARRLRDTGHKSLGLVPVNDRASVPAAATQLALALADAAIATVAIFDANPRAPFFPAAEASEELAGYLVVRLGPRVSALTPKDGGQAGGRDAALIERALRAARERYDYVLADLTGFEASGEQRWAFDLVEAVAIVARSGKTREHEVLRRHHEIPPERDLGVLILG